MSKPLNPDELVCFGFSRFDCEAKRDDDKVFVTVRMFRGAYYSFVCGPTLTLAEIQELTAYKLLTKLRVVENEVRDYAATFWRAEACGA